MLTPDQEEMREAAKAATAGEWRLRTHPRLGSFVEARTQSDMPYSLEILGDDYNGFGDDEQRDRDAAFVATANPAAILALLDQVEAQGWDVSYELMQGDEWVAGASGKDALKEIRHYAAVYSPDGPVEIIEVRRRALPPPPEAACPTSKS